MTSSVVVYTLLSYLQPLLLPSETPFSRYVKEHILEPLGLASTTYSYDTAKASGQLSDGMTRQGITHQCFDNVGMV
jgi:CubicO group peptidase (beta-lactamase class C family)